MRRSLRFRLLMRTSLAATAVLGCLGFALYFCVERSMNSAFNQALLTKARAVAGTAEQHGEKIVFDYAPDEFPKFSASQDPDYFQAWIEPGVVVRSPSLKSGDLPRPPAAKGYSYIDVSLPDGRPGRVIAMSITTTIELNAGGDSAESDSVRDMLLSVATDTVALQDGLRNFRWIVIALCSLAVAASGAILYWVVGRGVRPVERLASEIDAMRANDLSSRLEAPDAPTELEPVVEKLNGLLSRLDGAFKREKAFTADVAHELRNPLAALLTTFDVCRTRPRDEPAYIAAIDKCRDIARQMQAMVETLLTLTRADAGQLTLAVKSVDFTELLEGCWALFLPRAQAQGLAVQWRVPGSITIQTDPEKLRIILHNLFDNAVSYADRGGALHVTAQPTDSRLLVEIANTGSMIPVGKTGQLFERFWRGDRARTDAGLHCGLGLSLCQRLARLLSGQIEIESTPRNWFIVRLWLPAVSSPMKSPHAAGIPAAVESAGASA